MIEAILKQLGLSDIEAAIYAVLQANSPASATFIAKKTNLSRSTVYTALSALIAKSLVGTTYKNEVKQFVTEGVSALEQLIEKERAVVDKKMSLLSEAKAQMEKLSAGELNIPQVIFFEGQEGLKRIYSSMMREAEKNAVMYIMRDEFVWQKDWEFVFANEWKGKVKRIKMEKNIRTRLLVNPSEQEKSKISLYKKTINLDFRFLPEENKISNFAMYLVSDMVSILSFERNNLMGIKITNRNLADNFRKIFDLMWQK